MNDVNYDNTYVGLTIGPISKTIGHAKKTGELWGSSYIFSYIMKNIIKELRRGKGIKDRFIVPCVTDDVIFNNSMEVGLFHDRFIFKSNEGDFEKVNDAVEKVKLHFKDEVYKMIEKINTIEIQGFQERLKEDNIRIDIKDGVSSYIEKYFKIYFLEVEVDPNDKSEKDRNIILKVSKYLDALELKEQFVDEEETNYIFKILNNKYIKDSFLLEGDKKIKMEYPSLLNIALSELQIENLPTEDKKVIEKILSLEKSKKDKIKKVHEYVALVQVDGDFMGKRISGFKVRKESNKRFEEYNKFSKNLLEHAKEAHRLIKGYGGFTVFAGGDDLLFIAPLINFNSENKSKNIFELIDNISEQFDEKFNNKYDNEKVTLSFGVSMVHYKYPLYYALEEATNLLFEQAKNFKFRNKVKNKVVYKNCIAFKVIKSSGESFGNVIGKDSDSYIKFKELFKKVFSGKDNDEKIMNYLKNIHIKLLNDKVILNKIGKNKGQLKNYFKNNFDESIHSENQIKEYINCIIELVYSIYNESDDKEDSNKSINQIHSYLKIIKFMDEKSALKKGIEYKEKGEKDE